VDRAQRNLEDQDFQLSGRRASNTDLVRRYAAAEQYLAALNESQLERGTESTTVIAVGAPTAKATAHAVQQIKTHFAEELNTSLACRRGAQTALWQLGLPGSESQAPRSQFKQPTTTEQWSRFAPLLSSELGHETGILFADNMATRLRRPVFIEPESAPFRRSTPGMLWVGAPGGGKSQSAKRIVDGVIKRGSRVSIIDASGQLRTEYAELTAKLNMWASVDYLRAMFDESLPVAPIAEKDAVIWLTSDLELPSTSQTDNLHLYRRQSTRARAGLAIYGMISALTRVTNTASGRFGFLVAEECRTFLASPPGQAETVRILTQGRKEHTGFFGISQSVEHFDGIEKQYLPMRVITPFKPTDRDYARQAFKKMGIDTEEYPEVLETRTVAGHGYAYYIDDEGRAGLVDLLAPVQRQLVAAFNTDDLQRRDDRDWAA
jgi:hypothetical protein